MTATTTKPDCLKVVPLDPGTIHYDARATKGLKGSFLLSDRSTTGVTFTAGGRKAHIKTDRTDEPWGSDWVYANALVKLADGTEMNGVVVLCASDSCEHYGTYVFVREDYYDACDLNGHTAAVRTHVIDLHDETEWAAVGLTNERIFGEKDGPGFKGYDYNYRVQIGDRDWAETDHHTGDNGWLWRP